MNEQIEALAEALEGRTVDGWAFTYEYPGIFQFRNGATVVCCTPDYDHAGAVDVQVTNDDGDALNGWDVPYIGSLSAESFVELMRPELAKVIAK